MTPDLFVCHASEDGASHARHLTTEFETRGLRCWMAPRDIPAGSSWQSAIVAAIESSRAMLLLITFIVNGIAPTAISADRCKSFVASVNSFAMSDAIV